MAHGKGRYGEWRLSRPPPPLPPPQVQFRRRRRHPPAAPAPAPAEFSYMYTEALIKFLLAFWLSLPTSPGPAKKERGTRARGRRDAWQWRSK